MSRNRFKEILKFLRFDIESIRCDWLKTDKLTMVSEVWNHFIGNFISSCSPGVDITVDELFIGTKSMCPFTQYKASKPDKFGTKFWLATDFKSKYRLNGLPYLEKDANRPANNHFLNMFEKSPKIILETVAYYNSRKYGVNVVDQMARLSLQK